MTRTASWLKELIILNENDTLRPGDVRIFSSALHLRRHVETWWVQEVSHFALSGIGDRLILGVKGDQVVIEGTEEFVDGLELLREWLQPTAMRIHIMRAEAHNEHKAAKGSLAPDGQMPDSLEGLIAYIGFA